MENTGTVSNRCGCFLRWELFLALLITNRVYKEGKYTTKEAAIIATGFSTVSATFMIIIAKH